MAVSAAVHPQGRPRFEIAEIVRAHGEAYRARHALLPVQARALRDIERCRTAALGGHLDVCPGCGYEHPAYNSCRNRHCPKCQALAQARWVERRRERILPVRHFHIVFTMPAELQPIARANPERVFDLLFAAAANTLLALGRDPRWLGAQLGITAVLHTWTRDLRFHPHVHCIVTAGGLDRAGTRWIHGRRRAFLFPVHVLGALFRGKLLRALDRARARGMIGFDGPAAHLADPAAFARLRGALYTKKWVVYAKMPFGGADQIFRYLGRYTHRVGISNHRLLDVTPEHVTFATKHGRTVTLSPEDFLRRFLQHVLPRRYVKIRHYGLLASANVNDRLATARRLVASETPIAAQITDAPLTWVELLRRLVGVDVTACPRCGTTLEHVALPRPPDTS